MNEKQREAALRLAAYLSADAWPGGLSGTKLDEAAALLRELASEPQEKPLTDEQMNAILHAEIERDSGDGCAGRFARAIEKAHGIGEAP